MAKDDCINIPQWMSNQTIFITGVSGYVGKVLLWKILKSCPNVDSVYVLIRSKKGKTTQERLDALLSVSIFDEFKQNNPEVLKKVKAVEGDISEKRLGLKDSDWYLLQKNVTLLFNAAASVRFDDSLQKATFTNLRSAKYALLLAKGMKNLKVFVHVSTAFTNCHLLNIPEKVIPTEFDPEEIITIAENFDEHELEVITPKLLTDYPNTYIFTKNLAENLVYKHRHEIPLVIHRPSIVVSATKEPEPGWCDNISGIGALMIAGGKGILRVVHAKYDNCLDYVTVDSCANSMIVAAWYRDQHLSARKNVDENIVINATSFQLPLGKTNDYFCDLIYNIPYKNQLWRCFQTYSPNTYIFHFLTFFLHVIPGLLVDGILKLVGRKTMLMRIYRKLYVISVHLLPFNSYTFKFDTDNFKILKSVVLDEDKKKFYMDPFFETDREKYFVSCAWGSKKLVGELPVVTEKDKAHTYRLYWVDLIFRIILIRLLVWIIPFKSTYEWISYKINGQYNLF